jgi:hypothetical protein
VNTSGLLSRVMVKRKRTRSKSPGNQGSPGVVVAAPANPFLPALSAAQTVETENTLVVEHVIAFDDLSKQRGTTNIYAHVAPLLKHLKEHKCNDYSGGWLSLNEITLMLLPWSIRLVLGSKVFKSEKIVDESLSIVWECLDCCLSVISDTSNPSVKQTLSQKILGQSTLFLLVPRLALVAVTWRDKEFSERTDLSNVKCVERIKMYAANSFVNLVKAHSYYQPTLEVVCKSLLLPVVQELVELQVSNHGYLDAQKLVLTDILQLIDRLNRHGKGNPKTTFHLFTQKEILLSFTKAYLFFQSQYVPAVKNENGLLLVRQILYEGVFHPQNHMDGFRSLFLSQKNNDEKKEVLFRCYQEDLLSCIQLPLIKDATCEVEIAEMTAIFPVLLRCCVDAVAVWSVQHRSGSRKATPMHEVVFLQFQMFVRLASPLRELVKDALRNARNDVAVAALRALQECIGLLVEFDGYLPSQDDRDASQYHFLCGIANELLSLKASDDCRIIRHVNGALTYFIQLDHRVFDESISQVFSFCLQSDDETVSDSIAILITAIFDTYSRLRQQCRSLACLVEILLVSTGTEQQGREQIMADTLWRELKKTQVVNSISQAMQACPILEVVKVFELMKPSIETICSIDLEKTEVRGFSARLRVLVSLFSLVVRSIRVERGTAHQTALSCSVFVEESIGRLLARSNEVKTVNNDDGGLYKAAMMLCGWFIELHMRCAFWLGKDFRLPIPQQLLAGLGSSIEDSLIEENEQFLDEMLLLVRYRLIELQSAIYEQERDEFEESVNLESNTQRISLIDEATQLAAFATAIAKHPVSSAATTQRSRWCVLAESLASWVQYATLADVDWFVMYMFSVLSADPAMRHPPSFRTCHRDHTDLTMSDEKQCARA